MANYLVFLGLGALICKTGLFIKSTPFLWDAVNAFETKRMLSSVPLGGKYSKIQGSSCDHQHDTQLPVGTSGSDLRPVLK